MRHTFIIFICASLVACGTTQKVKSGYQAYELKKYALAIELLNQELQEEYQVAKHFLLARAYSEIDRIDEAVETYKTAINSETPSQYLLEYAYVLKRAEMYDDAIDIFSMLKTESNLDALLDREIQSCQYGIQWLRAPDTLTTLEGLPLNSSGSDYGPVIIDGRLLFTTDRVEEADAELYDWTGAAYSDIWSSSTSGTSEEPWTDAFNTDDNEGTPILTPDGQEIYFTRCYSRDKEAGYCHILWSSRTEDGWSTPRPVEALDGNFNVMHPAFSSDGNLLFFASDATGGIGGMDIYYCRRTQEGWSQPQNLGQRINGEGDEVFPHILRDTLYFSSTSHPGMGGLDLFYSFFDDEGQWVRPINLQTPFNSGADDFGIWIDTLLPGKDIRRRGYFSSSREGGKGRDDIYSFVTRIPEESTTEKPDIPLLLTIKVVKPIFRRNNAPNSGIRRLVPVEDATIRANDEEYTTDITGTIGIQVDSNARFNVRASAQDLLSASYEFDSESDISDGVGYIRLVLNPIFYDQEIVLRNIFYDFEKWDIREDARPALDSLTHILMDNPEIKILLASHTDCRGEKAFNQDLSEKRARSAVQYIIDQGVDSSRLTSVGYGESQPYIDCACDECSEEEHQFNRRTSFTILSD